MFQKSSPPRGVEVGHWSGGFEYRRFGSGSPVVYLPGLSARHRRVPPVDTWAQVAQLAPLATEHEVFFVDYRREGRREALRSGDFDARSGPDDMQGIAARYADAVAANIPGPVDLIGVSSGGSLALQIAADHPALVRRLVLVSSGHRLSTAGRSAQSRTAQALHDNDVRLAASALFSQMGGTRASQLPLTAVGWLLGGLAVGRGDADLVATIRAEDAFDLAPRLAEIAQPTLVIGGDRDRFYGIDVFRRTADTVQNGRLVAVAGKGHSSMQMNRAVVGEVRRFLAPHRAD